MWTGLRKGTGYHVAARGKWGVRLLVWPHHSIQRKSNDVVRLHGSVASAGSNPVRAPNYCDTYLGKARFVTAQFIRTRLGLTLF